MRATSAVASTLALQAAGIRAGTSDPPGGRIGRGPGGELSGLLESAAVYRVSGGGPEMSNDDVQALLRDLDSWHDIGDDWLRIWGLKLVMDGGWKVVLSSSRMPTIRPTAAT